LFQSAFAGHAEMGLTGSNNFTLKVSPDGSTWVDAVVVEQGSGKIGMGTNNPAYNLHISSTGSYLALEDSDGVLGGSMSAALRMFAGGVEHGQVGFPGTSSGIMYIRNLQGDLFIEADTRNLASASVIRFAVDGTESMRIEKNKVGIGTATPARALHVSSVMRLEPSTAPTSAAAGDIYFDNATKKLRCHNGTTWINLF
jgi:hypothetical protein